MKDRLKLRKTGGRRTSVSETICNGNLQCIRGKQQKFDRQTEQFKDHLALRLVTLITNANLWEM